MFSVLLCSYEEQSGRESVIELLAAIFNKFPEVCHHTITRLTCFVPWQSPPLPHACTTQRLIHRHASYFFVPLASQLISDESPTCRQMVAEAVKTLIGRVRFSLSLSLSLSRVCVCVCVRACVCVCGYLHSCAPPYSLTLLSGMILRAWLNCGSYMIRWVFSSEWNTP